MDATLLNKLHESFIDCTKPRKPNVFTTKEYAEAAKITKAGAEKRLDKLRQLGKIKPTKACIQKTNGISQTVDAWEYIDVGRSAGE